MKLIYEHENRLFVNNAQNILENEGIATTLKNEFASGASGELSPFDTWLQLWILDDNDIDTALTLLKKIEQTITEFDWLCAQCHETNGSAFEYCWNCNHIK